MANGKNGAAIDFLATFFVGSHIVVRKLSDVVANRENPLFRQTLELPEGFELPFFIEEDASSNVRVVRYNLRAAPGVYKPFVGEEQAAERCIGHGDYLAFKNASGEIAIRVLFVQTSNVKAGYKKFEAFKGKNYFIGRTESNEIAFGLSNHISREKHAAIRIDSDGSVFVEDLKRSIGVYVNGRQVHSQKLNLFDEVFIMGLSIVNCGSYIAVRDLAVAFNRMAVLSVLDVKSPVAKTDVKYFVRTPRILKSLDTDTVEIDAPPQPPSDDKTPAILVLGPSVTMSAVMLASLGVSLASALSGGDIATIIASGTMAVGMLAGSLLWPALLRNYQKRSAIAEEKHRRNRYSQYISELDKKLSAKNDRNVRLLNETFMPAPEQLCKLLDSESARLRLWERNSEDADFLYIRLGLGLSMSRIEVKIPKQGFQLHEDELRTYPAKIAEKYAYLPNTPIPLDLRTSRAVGIIGDRENTQALINAILLNLISLHSYDEVKLIIVCNEREARQFDFIKNVPHLWSADKKIRFFATSNDEVHYVFNAIDEVVKERETVPGKQPGAESIPHFVFLITEGFLIEGEALLRYLENSDNTVGVTSIFAYGDIAKLPKSCKTIIQGDDARCGYYSKNKNDNKFIEFALDKVAPNLLLAFASQLANMPIKVDSRSLGVPERITFLQTFKAGNVAELEIDKHWNNNNSAKSLAAPIGVMAGGEQFLLDIHEAYHGCHGLVAGTTGSGKSEFLQALVLSLAINYSPKEIAFVLVDFKGGDMARPFMARRNSDGAIVKHALPHLAATISNLSGNLLYRALISFNAEIKSRQNLFNQSATLLGVDKLDINSYHKYYKTGKLAIPLPHLVIIIDEFAQLKTQQPDFLAELINVAQVGRSLGIHLILATQKPSGVVDPQIWSNSRFKVCLKVADKQDSIDMINKPDSALIKNPGRCYVQVGYDEIYECVQSGYSGADYVPTKTYMPDDEVTVQLTDNTATPLHSAKLDFSSNKTDKTQLEAIVADIVSLGVSKGVFVKPLWKDMLPERIFLSELAKGAKTLLKATIALTDYVRAQEQKPLDIDFTQAGHIGIYGASGTGKTSLLQTLVYSLVSEYAYTPEELTIYAMDFGGRSLGYLNALPHVGDVVFEDNEGKIAALADLLQGIIDERKRIFAASNCGSFAGYHAADKLRIPAVLVLLDNYAPFREKYMDLSERFFGLISSGKTYGVYFVITGSTRNAIYYKVAEHISTYFMLKMNDAGNYFDILNVRPPIVPEDIKGRGITVINKEVVEFQVALAVDSETEAERVSSIYEKYEKISSEWRGALPASLSDDFVGDDADYSETSTITYATTIKSNPPDIIADTDATLVIGASVSGASSYGLDLADGYRLLICASDNAGLLAACDCLIMKISAHGNREIALVDGANGYYSELGSKRGVRYVGDSDALETYFEELKSELNERLEAPGGDRTKLFIIIADYNAFFEMATNEQAEMMRKITKYINSCEYAIYFICGFNVHGEKSNDRLFMDLAVNAEHKLVCPNSYGEAASKIENFPLIHDVKPTETYFCHNDRSTKIRW
jgi:S-DNA-T family DNA segregation ATPase FtsK/SpoIIIE